jgi:hypothetical protein
VNRILATVIAIAAGILMLVGYFFGHAADGSLNPLGELQLILLNWAVILAAFALFVGVINLLIVHGNKISQRQKGWGYSFILIIALVVTLAIGFLPPQYQEVGLPFVFKAIQLPVEASLIALLTVTLTYASVRLLGRRRNLFSIIFILFALLILLGTAPLPLLGYLPGLGEFLRPIIAQVLAAGGARGILMGVALGTLTTGLRILFGADRPYGGK